METQVIEFLSRLKFIIAAICTGNSRLSLWPVTKFYKNEFLKTNWHTIESLGIPQAHQILKLHQYTIVPKFQEHLISKMCVDTMLCLCSSTHHSIVARWRYNMQGVTSSVVAASNTAHTQPILGNHGDMNVRSHAYYCTGASRWSLGWYRHSRTQQRHFISSYPEI